MTALSKLESAMLNKQRIPAALPAETTVDIARRVVANSQAEEVDGVLLDLYTASAIVAVYDALSQANRVKLAAMPLTKAANTALVLVAKKMAAR